MWVQNLTSYSYSVTLISYKGEEILLLSCLVFEIWRGSYRQTTDVVTETEGSHTVSGLHSIQATDGFTIMNALFTDRHKGHLLTMATKLYPFNGLFFRTTWLNRHKKGKPFWILLKQDMTGWHQPDHMQIICTSLRTDNHTSSASLNVNEPDAVTGVKPTASKHWRNYRAPAE